MIDNSVAPAMVVPLGASLPDELIDRLTPRPHRRATGGLATDLHLRPMVGRGGGHHAITHANT